MLASFLSEPMTAGRWILAVVVLAVVVPIEAFLIVTAKFARTRL